MTTIEWIALIAAYVALVYATIWYAHVVIRPLCPDWWRRVIIDDAPGEGER